MLVTLREYADELGISQQALGHHVNKFKVKPAIRDTINRFHKADLERIFPRWQQLDLFTPASA